MKQQTQTTVEKRLSKAEYQARRRRHSVVLYFRDVEELDAYRQASKEGGYAHNFNGWLLQMLSNATGGSLFPPEYVDGLTRDLERTRNWLETAREENQDYRAQVKVLQQERDTLLSLLHGCLPAGPNVAARFLEQAASRVEVRS